MTRPQALKTILLLLTAPVAGLWLKLMKNSETLTGVQSLVIDEKELANGRTIISDVIAIKADNELRFYSARCTHLGCKVKTNGEGFICPCHGSKYDKAGKVINGPAPKDLRELRYEVNSGKILVRKG